jgi:hypothetical protein
VEVPCKSTAQIYNARVQDENPSNPIHFRAWFEICKPKALRGLGIRALQTVKKSLVLYSALMIANKSDPLLYSILKAKYFSETSFLEGPLLMALDLCFGVLS